MTYLTNLSLLPKQRLEKDFKVALGSIIVDQMEVLQKSRPRIYQDLLTYMLDPFEFPVQKNRLVKQPRPSSSSTNSHPNQNPNKAPLYWQRLILSDLTICSELVIVSWQSAIYIGYLNILPETFGLFSPLSPEQAMRYVDSLIAETINNIVGVTMVSADIGMVSTLINPNLAAMFKRQGFEEDPSGPQIEGLPLPARFYRSLLVPQG